MSEVVKEPIHDVAAAARPEGFARDPREPDGRARPGADLADSYEAIGAIDGRIARVERRREIIDTPHA